MEKSCRKCAPKQNILKKNYQKALKKLTLFFLSKPAPFNGQINKNRRDLEPVTSRSSGYKTSLEKFLY